MFNGTGYNLSDIAAVTNGNNGGFGGFGNNGDGWWIIILFLLFGWGRNGNWGGNGGSGDPVTRADLCQDMNFSQVEDGIRGIQQGLCDGFYAVNTSLLNGFAGVDNAICNLGYQTQSGINSVNVANMQNTNAIQTQLSNCCCDLERQIADCCCENRAAIADVRYAMATDTCALQTSLANSTRDIIDNQNCNTRQIIDFLVQDKISTLENENQSLKFAASQAQQNIALGAMMDANTAEILRRTAPTPVPAYPASYPQWNFGGCGTTFNSCGGCGCGDSFGFRNF